MSKITLKLVSQASDIKNLEIDRLDLNINLQDHWATFSKNSVASFKKVLIRLNIDKQDQYLILENVFLTYIDNNIELRYNDNLVFYKQIAKENNEIKQAAAKVKEIKLQINLQQAYYQLSVDSLDKTKIQQLQDQLFLYQAIENFNLVKEG